MEKEFSNAYGIAPTGEFILTLDKYKNWEELLRETIHVAKLTSHLSYGCYSIFPLGEPLKAWAYSKKSQTAIHLVFENDGCYQVFKAAHRLMKKERSS